MVEVFAEHDRELDFGPGPLVVRALFFIRHSVLKLSSHQSGPMANLARFGRVSKRRFLSLPTFGAKSKTMLPSGARIACLLFPLAPRAARMTPPGLATSSLGASHCALENALAPRYECRAAGRETFALSGFAAIAQLVERIIRYWRVR